MKLKLICYFKINKKSIKMSIPTNKSLFLSNKINLFTKIFMYIQTDDLSNLVDYYN